MSKVLCIALSILCGAQSLQADHCPGQCEIKGKRVLKRHSCNAQCPSCEHDDCKPCPTCKVCMKCDKKHARGQCPINS